MPDISSDDGVPVDDDGTGGDEPEPNSTPVTVDIAVALFQSQNPRGARVGSVVVAREPGQQWGSEEKRLYLIVPNVTMTTSQRAGLHPAADAVDSDKFLGVVNLTALMATAAPGQANEYMTKLLDPCQRCQPFLTDGVRVPANVMDHLTISEGQVP